MSGLADELLADLEDLGDVGEDVQSEEEQTPDDRKRKRNADGEDSDGEEEPQDPGTGLVLEVRARVRAQIVHSADVSVPGWCAASRRV